MNTGIGKYVGEYKKLCFFFSAPNFTYYIVYMHRYVNTYTYSLCIHMYIIHICAYKYVFTCVFMYTYTHICMGMYVFMYKCV